MTTNCWCGGTVDSGNCVDSQFHDPYSDGRPGEVKRLYVSGPMSGYPDCNYPAFRVAAERLRAAGYDVVDPADCSLPGRVHYVDFLKEDVRNLLTCEGVATLDRWWESAGARCEVTVAGTVRMPVRSVEDWLSMAAIAP